MRFARFEALPRLAEGAGEIGLDVVKRKRQCLIAPDENIVDARFGPAFAMEADRLAQSPADPVTDNRIADLLGHREATARLDRSATAFDRCCRLPISSLQNEAAPSRPHPLGDSQKLGAFLQSFHLDTASAKPPVVTDSRVARGQDQADRRLRPRARRRARTRRPPTVWVRARKPWRRLRTSFEG